MNKPHYIRKMAGDMTLFIKIKPILDGLPFDLSLMFEALVTY